MEWKLKYIEAFNQMEEKLKTPKLTPNLHYRPRMIKTAVKDLSETADVIAELFGVKKRMTTTAAMKRLWQYLLRRCSQQRPRPVT